MDLPGQRDQGGTARQTRRSTGQPEPLGSHGSARRCSRGGGSSRSNVTSPGSTEPAGCMDGTGEQREEFGRRREPNTISWEVHESRCRGRNEFPQCGSTGIFRIPGVGGAQLGDFTTSLPPSPPSAIPAPGSHSRQGICCWSCAAALLSLSHTHTQREQQHHGRPRNGFTTGTAPAGKIPPAQPVLLFPGAFPSDSHSTALQGED